MPSNFIHEKILRRACRETKIMRLILTHLDLSSFPTFHFHPKFEAFHSQYRALVPQYICIASCFTSSIAQIDMWVLSQAQRDQLPGHIYHLDPSHQRKRIQQDGGTREQLNFGWRGNLHHYDEAGFPELGTWAKPSGAVKWLGYHQAIESSKESCPIHHHLPGKFV